VNVVCYPASEHQAKCPITSIDVVSLETAKALEQKGYQSSPLWDDLALVFSKTTDSLPITSIRVEHKPCALSDYISSKNGTISLPNEVMQAGECPVEPNTGFLTDERYKAAQLWSLSEAEIMRENHVFDLFREQWNLTQVAPFSLLNDTIPKMEASRAANSQKLWLRPTIVWRLECERNSLKRSDAFKIF